MEFYQDDDWFEEEPEELVLWKCATPKEEVLGTVCEIKQFQKFLLRK